MLSSFVIFFSYGLLMAYSVARFFYTMHLAIQHQTDHELGGRCAPRGHSICENDLSFRSPFSNRPVVSRSEKAG